MCFKLKNRSIYVFALVQQPKWLNHKIKWEKFQFAWYVTFHRACVLASLSHLGRRCFQHLKIKK